jgi:hypothetical protein
MTALPFAMPVAEHVGAVLEKLTLLAGRDAWEHSGDGTLCMAIAGPYHLVVQKLFGRVSISVTVEQWKLMVQLHGATLDEGRTELCRTLTQLLTALAPPAPAPVVQRPHSLETVVQEMGRRHNWPIPWMELIEEEVFPVPIPEGMSPQEAYTRVRQMAYMRSRNEPENDGRQFRAQLNDDVLTVTRTL